MQETPIRKRQSRFASGIFVALLFICFRVHNNHRIIVLPDNLPPTNQLAVSQVAEYSRLADSECLQITEKPTLYFIQ